MASQSSSAPSVRRNSNTQLLEELEALSQSLYQTHTTNTNPATTSNRRTASLALPRTSILSPIISSDEPVGAAKNDDKLLKPKPRSRRMSLSPFRSRPKLDGDHRGGDEDPPKQKLEVAASSASASGKKGGLWNWKPIRALSHIGMQKLSCLFSVEVVTVQGLPASMNGLRLSVCVRKKETKDGAVHTMPSRVSQGAADFEETLFIRCHVYCSPSSSSSAQQQHVKLEPRPFLIYVFAVDAPELDLGRNYVDLSLLIQESIDKSSQGTRVRQWDLTFDLSGKAKGGEVVLKLGFQLMEKDGGGGGVMGILYSSPSKSNTSNNKSRSFGRKQSKSSFSIPSPKMSGRSAEAWNPSQSGGGTPDLHGIDDLNLDEEPLTSADKSQGQEPDAAEANNNKMEDVELPEFEIVDKGVEIQDKVASGGREYSGQSDGENSDERSVSSSGHEVVKEIVHDQLHLTRLSELDSIARQIKALESMMITDDKPVKADEETESQRLDADEETVTREFLQMLEVEDEDRDADDYLMIRIKQRQQQHQQHVKQLEGGQESESNSKVFLADLGKALGCVVQTRDGGYLAAMNPLDTMVTRKDTPKLAMQTSKPLVLVLAFDHKDDHDGSITKGDFGFELFQRMAGLGSEVLGSEIGSLMPLDELMGKTAEQIAFEGVASAIIQGRNKEGASSSAARTIAALKSMASAMSSGRKERISTGIWNLKDDAVGADDILALSMPKIEAMAIEALKIQADVAEKLEAPFEVSPLPLNNTERHPLASALALEDWMKKEDDEGAGAAAESVAISLILAVQLRDPLRRYETVGGPVMVLINASRIDNQVEKFRVSSMHLGGLKLARRNNNKRNINVWDAEKQRLTAMQWLVAYGLGKQTTGKRSGMNLPPKHHDLLWSISSRVMADMWLKPTRNPDIKLSN